MIENVILKLLKHLRGNETQKAMSQQLGIKEYEYHKWEAGYKKITCQNFTDLCTIRGYNFKLILQKTLNISNIGDFKSDTIQHIANAWLLHENEFLKASGFSKSKWWRLNNENKELLLTDLFKVIDSLTPKLAAICKILDFSESIYDDKSIEDLQMIDSILDSYKSTPQLAKIIAALFTEHIINQKDLKLKSQAIEAKLNITADVVYKCLLDLLNRGLISFEENGHVKFLYTENHLDGNEIDKSLPTVISLFEEAAEKIKNCNQLNHPGFSFRVAPVSHEALNEINKLQAKYHKELAELIERDSSPRKYVLSTANIQLID